MINLDNGFDRFLNAVTTMASSPKPLRDRLYSAWVTLVPLRAADFDPELRDRFIALHEQATAVIGGSEGSLKATLDQMSDEELEDHTEGLTALFTAVAYNRGNGDA